MQVTVMGSADASNSGGRGHSCYWVDGATPRGLMVDFGGTALMQLRRFGRTPSELDTLLFTHLHGDHIGGFPYLYVDTLHNSQNAQRTERLHVVGPLGVESRLMAYVDVAYGSVGREPLPFDLTWQELLPGGEVQLDGCTVRGFKAEHMSPPERPLCLRITARGRSVAFSGDTRMCDGLRAAADGVDLLVAECTAMRSPSGKHCNWELWLDELPSIGAKRVLLTHLGVDVRREVEALSGAAPDGVDLVFADDGLVLDLL